MSYSADIFVADEQPTTAKWNKLWTNDASFNDGTGIADGAITADKLVSDATGHGFLEIARTTLTSAGDTLTVSSIPARKYLKFGITLLPTGGTISAIYTLNGDSGANYSRQVMTDGGAGSDAVSLSSQAITSTVAEIIYGEITYLNIANQEKLGFWNINEQITTGAGTAPNNRFAVHKWANTSNQISSITFANSGSGDFAIGSEIVVMGKD